MKNTKIVNLTPHPVTLILDGYKMVFDGSTRAARCQQETKQVRKIGETIPITQTVFGEIENLPDPRPDTFFIVSRLVLSAAAEMGRNDLLVPNEIVRDKDHNIIGCRSLSSN